MLDKMLGVSPPPIGEAPEAKIAESNSVRNSEERKALKDQFEKALKEKSETKAESKKAKSDTEIEEQSEQATKGESRLNKKESSGGTKKKMTEKETEVVSQNMASQESVNETPNPEIKDSAQAEASSLITEEEIQNAAAMAGAATAAESILQNSALVAKPASEQELAQQVKAILNSEMSAATDLTGVLPLQVAPQHEMGISAEPQVPQQSAPQLNSQLNPKLNLKNIEADLGKAVNYVADPNRIAATEEGVRKLGQIETSGSMPQSVNSKTTNFENHILAQLQKEQSNGQSMNQNQNMSQFSQQFSQEQNSSSDSKLNAKSLEKNEDFKSLKSEMNYHDIKAALHNMQQVDKPTHAGIAAGLSALAGGDNGQMMRLEENREQNIGEIMKQAQYLVKQGGGEVFVKMTPEGLGEVQLKVLLQDGKLNIEMQTQDKNVKKLIEDSLGELKSGLAGQRLSLDHVKIETVNATNTENKSQLQSNLNQGGSEGRAREMWSDFQGNMSNQSKSRGQQQESSGSRQESSELDSRFSKSGTTNSELRSYGRTGATLNRVA